jgi:ATP adenylyltransferase
MPVTSASLTVENVTDPAEVARIHHQHEQAQRNSAGLETHWDDLLPSAFGRFKAVAGAETYLADSSQEPRKWAQPSGPMEPAAFDGDRQLQHEQLWAPWRLGYIKAKSASDRPREVKLPPDADPGCFICRALADDDDRANLIVRRGRHTVAILNRYPYNNGHLLVACQRHLGRLDQLDAPTHLEAIETISQMTGLMERLMNAEGFNVGLNLGRVAGAGVPGHLHWHLVPRWSGDTNFMPVLAGIDILPQSLDALWELLTEALAGQVGPRDASP